MSAPLKPSSCSSCPLSTLGGKTWSNNEGCGENHVMLAGEALGDHEAWEGLPFRPQAQAGSELERAFRRGGWNRQNFTLTNCVRCKPPRNFLDSAPWERGALDACRTHLLQTVEQFNPKVIVTLGRLPTREFTGLWGDKQGILMTRGFICDDKLFPSIPVIPSVHPSFIARGGGIQAEAPGEKKSGVNPKHLRGTLIRDLQLALRVAQVGFTRPKEDYWIFPPREAGESFLEDCRRHPELTIFVDIETPESMTLEGEDENERFNLPVVQIQFSIREGHSIVFPWEEPFISLSREILLLPNAKAGYNLWDFDEPVLRHNNTPMKGLLIDTMAAWRMWQPDLPQGLQFATSFALPEAGPWKHIHTSQPGVYGGKDSNFNLITHNWILKRLASKGMLRTYERHVEQYHQTLTVTSRRGVPVDRVALTAFGEKVEKDLEEKEKEMQSLHPDELKNVSPESGYIRDPEDTTGLVRREFDVELAKKDLCLDCMGEGKLEVEVEKTLKNGKVKKGTKREKCAKCGGKGYTSNGKEPQRVERWCNLLPFKTSQKQIVSYLKWKIKEEEETLPKTKRIYKVPTVREKDGRVRETTEEVELEKLYRKTLKHGREDLLLGKIRERRKLEKILSSYVKPWMPGEDGRVHTTFRFSTATGQLAAVRPNVLTLLKKGKLAQEFRKAIAAPEGYWLVEADWNSFHAKTLGLEAQDAAYMRLASLDIHSFVACHMLHTPERDRLITMEDKELKALLTWYREQPTLYHGKTFEEVRGEKAKPAILGIGFGQGASDVYRRNEESFESEKEVLDLKALLKALFPKVFEFQDRVVWEAYNSCFLQTKYNYIRWFWDAKTWDTRTRQLVNGSEAEAAMALRPANDAHGQMRDTVLGLDENGLLDKWGFIIPYHDAVYYVCPDQMVDECCFETKRRMEAPNLVLADPVVAPLGFTCGVDVKVGRTLAKEDMHPWEVKK